MLFNIHAGGVQTLCSDLIAGGNRPGEVQFLSVAGPQTAVKGILASLLEGYTLTIHLKDMPHHLVRAEPGYQMRVSRLASGLAHGVVFPQSALMKPAEAKDDEQAHGRFFLMSHELKATQSIFFRQLNARLDLPLHESWGSWLWRLFEDASWLTKLDTLAGHFEGWLVNLQPDLLQIEITQALQEKQPELMACFQAA